MPQFPQQYRPQTQAPQMRPQMQLVSGGGAMPRNNMAPSQTMRMPNLLPNTGSNIGGQISGQLGRMYNMQRMRDQRLLTAQRAEEESGRQADYEIATERMLRDELMRRMGTMQPTPPTLPPMAQPPMQEPEPLPLDDYAWEDEDDLPWYDYPRSYDNW